MDESTPSTAAEMQHCLTFLTTNADGNIRKDAHRVNATPLCCLCDAHPDNARWREASVTLHAKRSVVSFTTRRSSFDLWASLGDLENLLSDFRRIAPRFKLMQLAGEAGIAAGNEYRLTNTDPGYLADLKAVCNKMAPDQDNSDPGNERSMDIRVTRAGPWGGETGELVVEALENHALAGASSLWLVAHGETTSGDLLVTLDAFEISRWAWAPDFVAHGKTPNATEPVCIINWHYLFERLVQEMDGTPEPGDGALSFESTFLPPDLQTDSRIADALRSHSALVPLVDQVQIQDINAP